MLNPCFARGALWSPRPRSNRRAGVVSASEGIEQGSRGVSRLAVPVLRHLAEHPEARLTEREIQALSGVDPHDAQRLAQWLTRSGLLRRHDGGEEAVYDLAYARQQRRARTRPLIMLVEDHNSIAGMTEAVLTSEGYNVVL